MKPTEEQIEETIELIKGRLQDENMNLDENKMVRIGYEKAIKTLEARDENYNGISNLAFEQSRTIAVLASEYLQGEVEQHILVGVPIINPAANKDIQEQ